MSSVGLTGYRTLNGIQAVGGAFNAGENFANGKPLQAGVDLLGVAGNLATFKLQCFVAGTPIRTPTGWIPIQEIRVADLVLSRSQDDPEGPLEAKVVEEVFIRSGMVFNIRIKDKEIGTTAEHPFYVYNRGWVPAGELSVGDFLCCEDGEWRAVDDVQDTRKILTVYNLRVAEHHTYFIGAQTWGFSVWAHNAGPEYQLIQGTIRPGGKNPSYTRLPIADANSTIANRVLQRARMRAGLPVAGSVNDVSTVATIRVVDPSTGETVVKLGSVIKTNAHGLNPPNFNGAGAVAPTHAEAGTLFAANSKVNLQGKSVTIFTDGDPCAFCDKARGIQNIATTLGGFIIDCLFPKRNYSYFLID